MNTTRKVRVAVWGGLYHLLKHEMLELSTGPVTVCGLQLREFMDLDEAEERGLKLCRYCGEDRG